MGRYIAGDSLLGGYVASLRDRYRDSLLIGTKPFWIVDKANEQARQTTKQEDKVNIEYGQQGV